MYLSLDPWPFQPLNFLNKTITLRQWVVVFYFHPKKKREKKNSMLRWAQQQHFESRYNFRARGQSQLLAIAARTGSLERVPLKPNAIMKATRGWRPFNTLIGIDSPLEAAPQPRQHTTTAIRLSAGKDIYLLFVGPPLRQQMKLRYFHNEFGRKKISRCKC